LESELSIEDRHKEAEKIISEGRYEFIGEIEGESGEKFYRYRFTYSDGVVHTFGSNVPSKQTE